MQYATISMYWLLFSIMLTSHFIACLLGLFPALFTHRLQSWQATFGYCKPDESFTDDQGIAHGWLSGNISLPAAVCVDHAMLYLTCFHWGEWG